MPPASHLFLDANAGIPARPEALETFQRVARDCPANPSSLHTPGRRAQGVLEDARDRVAALLRRRPREIVFTSGATEGCNIALLGVARARRRLEGAPCALISSRAEHPAVLGPLRLLQQEGHPLRLLPLDAHARVAAADLAAAAKVPGGGVVALQWANNETGAIQDLEAAADLAGAAPLHLHCDAAQGIGKLPWATALDAFHTIAFSGHKFGAPKGFGVLVVGEDVLLDPPFAGGGQQHGVRPGTESPAGAAALATALELALAEQAAFARRAGEASALLLGLLRDAIPGLGENHPSSSGRLPNTLNLTLPGLDGRVLLAACDAEGLALSSGSACASGSAQPSPVLLACGLSPDRAISSLRLSFGWDASEALAREAARRLLRIPPRAYQLANA